jgi:hypothetical protein
MTKFAIHKDYGQRPKITYHLADAAEQRPNATDSRNRSRKQTQLPRISGIETGNGHCESGFRESV